MRNLYSHIASFDDILRAINKEIANNGGNLPARQSSPSDAAGLRLLLGAHGGASARADHRSVFDLDEICDMSNLRP
jgi:hypothetical protein